MSSYNVTDYDCSLIVFPKNNGKLNSEVILQKSFSLQVLFFYSGFQKERTLVMISLPNHHVFCLGHIYREVYLSTSSKLFDSEKEEKCWLPSYWITILRMHKIDKEKHHVKKYLEIIIVFYLIIKSLVSENGA